MVHKCLPLSIKRHYLKDLRFNRLEKHSLLKMVVQKKNNLIRIKRTECKTRNKREKGVVF